MLPIRRTQAHPSRIPPVLRVKLEVVISKTFVSRASRVDAKLISSTPSLLDMTT